MVKIKRQAESPSFWRHRRCFVTGGSGLLGSELVSRLLNLGADPVLLLRDRIRGSRLFSEGLDSEATIISGELEDFPKLLRILNEYEIRTVFHLGAQTIVGVANSSPLSTFESNIRGSYHLLEACRLYGKTSEIVIASSDKAYGAVQKLPYTEETPLVGDHPYDVSKSCTDLIARSYFHSFKLPVVVTRCGNFFGPGDLNFNRIVPQTIRSLHHGERPVIRSDGTFIRDYFFIGDGAQAYTHLAERVQSQKLAGEAFNFSNEIQVTVLQLVQLITRLMGEKLTPIIQNQASNEIRHQYLSAEKARRLLGWRPQFELEESLKLTIRWYREFFRESLS